MIHEAFYLVWVVSPDSALTILPLADKKLEVGMVEGPAATVVCSIA